MYNSNNIILIIQILQILPPLKDVMTRPEVGTTLRSKLCKLLTSPLTELRDLVAELLFVLCKENGIYMFVVLEIESYNCNVYLKFRQYLQLAVWLNIRDTEMRPECLPTRACWDAVKRKQFILPNRRIATRRNI